jgi:hypothetical protein
VSLKEQNQLQRQLIKSWMNYQNGKAT